MGKANLQKKATANEVLSLFPCEYPVYPSAEEGHAIDAGLGSAFPESAESVDTSLTAKNNSCASSSPLPCLIGKAWEASSLSKLSVPSLAVPSAVLQESLQSSAYSPSVRARLFPNGEFSLGFVPPPEKLKKDCLYDAGIVDDYVSLTTAYAVVTEDGDVFFDVTKSDVTHLYKLDKCQESSQIKKRYGQNGMTGYGRKCVRNLCFLMERDMGCSHLNFGTCTVPRLTASEELIVCRNWSEVVRYFFQSLRRRYAARCKGDFRYVSVTELQPKRWQNRGEVGLHLHFLYEKIYDPERGEHVFSDNFLRTAWHSALSSVLGRFSADGDDDPSLVVPMFRRETVTGGVDKYLAKYMSKGGELLREVKEKKPDVVLPAQWWSTDSVSRRNLKSETITLPEELASLLLDAIVCVGVDSVVYAKAVEVPIGGQLKVVGFAGVVHEDFGKYLRRCYSSQSG